MSKKVQNGKRARKRASRSKAEPAREPRPDRERLRVLLALRYEINKVVETLEREALRIAAHTGEFPILEEVIDAAVREQVTKYGLPEEEVAAIRGELPCLGWEWLGLGLRVPTLLEAANVVARDLSREASRSLANHLAAVSAELVAGELTPDDALSQARRARRDGGPDATVKELRRAAKRKPGGRSADPLTLVHRVYQVLAWNADVDPRPETHKTPRGRLRELLSRECARARRSPESRAAYAALNAKLSESASFILKAKEEASPLRRLLRDKSRDS